ncbi:NH(3)-dependent NAD(+) synthetase [Capnocytophaga stomatis]|uniref:NH(3)-dependent NAD(+) synthetase n=2 Tax=Capnocytophaga TaxID=1016 RepID=A0A250FWS8_9FLAO|nr:MULTISPECIES: NAD(+) synthase [Capnocytophaga]ATA89533.1 NAD(+) synthase [Capnocytophaga stomatis]GET46141.1 NH(3)-dependent NAD(+) synthetase [Capnocytophaga felis]GET48934.1 NH(3)-dependent NAD(+) synthetase [Capnocytophaga felis]GIJ94819.1 NH(3)-dependent NAD(+) synthetase [Capnocytophaga stomatis]GIJ97489.1 NH(3)-dependent NAD(+) synthetase [Capnocytophaga stomatis]
MNAEKVSKHIVQWLQNYVESSRVKGLVIGISGGVDSAVVSTLCAKTGLPTLCLELPIHQAESHVSRAKEHIDFLKKNYTNVSSLEVDLTPVFDQFVSQIPETDKPTYEMALANTRARLRMTTLYYFAGLEGYIVVGTGNKIEDFGVGFFTKYGDGGVDVSPIADLMKSEVYLLGKHLKIPESILNAKPSDGLFGDDRSDEDQLKASYDELEWAMLQDEKGKQADDFSGREKEVFQIYKRLNKINQHKMNPIPICKIEDKN